MHVCICVGILMVIRKQHLSPLDAKELHHSRDQRNIIETSKGLGQDGDKGFREIR